MKKINRYECPKCHQHITLYGGSTNGTSVVCENCNVWMHVGNPHSIKIIKDNTEMPGLQALEFVVPDSTIKGEKHE